VMAALVLVLVLGGVRQPRPDPTAAARAAAFVERVFFCTLLVE
jgi:hypothetical protein